MTCLAFYCYADHTCAHLTSQSSDHSASTGFAEVCMGAAEIMCLTGLSPSTDVPSWEQAYTLHIGYEVCTLTFGLATAIASSSRQFRKRHCKCRHLSHCSSRLSSCIQLNLSPVCACSQLGLRIKQSGWGLLGTLL